MKGLTVGHLPRLGGPGRPLWGAGGRGEAGAGGWTGFPCLKGGLEGDPGFAENFSCDPKYHLTSSTMFLALVCPVTLFLQRLPVSQKAASPVSTGAPQAPSPAGVQGWEHDGLQTGFPGTLGFPGSALNPMVWIFSNLCFGILQKTLFRVKDSLAKTWPEGAPSSHPVNKTPRPQVSIASPF